MPMEKWRIEQSKTYNDDVVEAIARWQGKNTEMRLSEEYAPPYNGNTNSISLKIVNKSMFVIGIQY